MIRNCIDVNASYRLDNLTKDQYLACQDYLCTIQERDRQLFKEETTMKDVVRFHGNMSYDGKSYWIVAYASTEYLDVNREVDGEKFDIPEAFMRLREGIKELKDVMKDLTQICEEL